MNRTRFGCLACWLGWACLSLGLPAAAAGAIPSLQTIPAALPESQRAPFVPRQKAINAEWARFRAAASAFNAKPAEEQSDGEFAALSAERTRYIRSVEGFNQDLNRVVEAFTILKLNSLAGQLDWSVKKKDQLACALKALRFDGDPDATSAQISQAWSTVLARGEDGPIAQDAAAADGLGFAGAGTQTVNNDCAIFALANAAGLPYGVVAARAGKLIKEGEWRDPAARNDPQRIIEHQGLIGGEVVMLAEAFGQAEVVPRTDFARILREGRPVLVNVVPPSGDVDAGHEVVLTKVFQHEGETWYAMMDSNQGPQRRLFVSSAELSTMLKERGVAFRPEEHTMVESLK